MKSTLFVLFFLNVSFAQSPWTPPRLIDNTTINSWAASIEIAVGPQREVAIVPERSDTLFCFYSTNNGRTFACTKIDYGWSNGMWGESMGPFEAVGFDSNSRLFAYGRRIFWDEMVRNHSFRVSRSVNHGHSFSPSWISLSGAGGIYIVHLEKAAMFIDSSDRVHTISETTGPLDYRLVYTSFSAADSLQARKTYLTDSSRGSRITGDVFAQENAVHIVLATGNYASSPQWPWLHCFRSTDAGATFSGPTVVDTLYPRNPRLLRRTGGGLILVHTNGGQYYDTALVMRTMTQTGFSSSQLLLNNLQAALDSRPSIQKRGSEIHLAYTRYLPDSGVAYYRFIEFTGTIVDSMFLPDHSLPTLALDSLGGIYLVTAYQGRVYLSTKDVVLDVDDHREALPRQVHLAQNYPNPFNPTTMIEFDLPRRSDVSLVVYDVLGRQVERLVSDVRDAGRHSISFDASTLSSGVYFYRLVADGLVQTKKMIALE